VPSRLLAARARAVALAGGPSSRVSCDGLRPFGFRRLFLEALQKAYPDGKLEFFSDLQPLRDAATFAAYPDPLRGLEWVVYAKPPFGGPQQVLEYLSKTRQLGGRYTHGTRRVVDGSSTCVSHRVAICNERLVSLQDGQVTFRWKDYRQEQHKLMTVPADDFIRRFLAHALPPGFQRIRHYGLLANAHRRDALAVCQKLLAAPVSDLLPRPAMRNARRRPVNDPSGSVDYRDWYEALTGESLRRCPQCDCGTMLTIEILAPCREHVPAILDTS